MFDTGASHSFIYAACALSLRLKLKRLGSLINIGILMGSNFHCQYCTTIISLHSDCHVEGNFILMDMNPYDLIIGMDWLSKYQAIIIVTPKGHHLSPLGNKICILQGKV